VDSSLGEQAGISVANPVGGIQVRIYWLTEDRTHGHQELAFYNHHYASHCYLPLFLFEGLSGKLITAVLRPGKRPTGRENAAIIGRVLRRLRQAWPDTHIVLRGDGHFANPALMALCN
jgi:hypothetical protein